MPPAYSQPPYYANMQPALPSMPMYGVPMMVNVRLPVMDPGAGQATTGLILGTIALVFSVLGFVPFFGIICGSIAFILGILGIIFGAIGRRSVTRKGQATAGLVTSIIAVVLPVVVSILIVIASTSAAVTH